MPTNWGTQVDLSNLMGVSRSTVTKWKNTGKLKGLIRNGKINLDKAPDILKGRIPPKQQASANARWGKAEQRGKPKPGTPETEAEIKTYLDESIGDLSKLDIYELQRRNELEKLLLQQIKRKRESAELVLSADIESKSFDAARAIRDSIVAIPERCAPLVAAESSDFKCKQIMLKEVNYILEDLSQKLEVI